MEGDEEQERTQQDQIDEAVDALQKGTVGAPQEEEETSGQEEPTEESEKTRSSESPEGEEAEGVEEPVGEGEDTGEEDDEPVDPRVAKLEAKLEQTQSQLEELRESSTPEEEEETTNEPIQFIENEEQAEMLLEDPMKLNELLNQVLQKGRELAMREVPPVVLDSVNRTMTIKERAQEFYKENPELADHKEFVGHIANKLSSKYDNDLDKLFDETAKEARKKLNISKKAEERERGRRKSGESARFARKPGAGRQPQPDERSDQQKQIDQMIDELGR